MRGEVCAGREGGGGGEGVAGRWRVRGEVCAGREGGVVSGSTVVATVNLLLLIQSLRVDLHLNHSPSSSPSSPSHTLCGASTDW